MKLDHVIEFYGETCPHCISMRPVIAQLEKELGGEITKLEVWNHPENEKKMQNDFQKREQREAALRIPFRHAASSRPNRSGSTLLSMMPMMADSP